MGTNAKARSMRSESGFRLTHVLQIWRISRRALRSRLLVFDQIVRTMLSWFLSVLLKVSFVRPAVYRPAGHRGNKDRNSTILAFGDERLFTGAFAMSGSL